VTPLSAISDCFSRQLFEDGEGLLMIFQLPGLRKVHMASFMTARANNGSRDGFANPAPPESRLHEASALHPGRVAGRKATGIPAAHG
jgi:hypothetical protein